MFYSGWKRWNKKSISRQFFVLQMAAAAKTLNKVISCEKDKKERETRA